MPHDYVLGEAIHFGFDITLAVHFFVFVFAFVFCFLFFKLNYSPCSYILVIILLRKVFLKILVYFYNSFTFFVRIFWLSNSSALISLSSRPFL